MRSTTKLRIGRRR